MISRLCKISTVSNIFNCENESKNDIDSMFMSHVAEYGLSFGTKEEYNFRKSLFVQANKELEEIRKEGGSFEVAHN